MATGTQTIPPFAILSQMVMGSFLTQAIYVAAELAIADIIKDGPQTAAEIAKATNTNADAMNRILRSLAGVGIFREIEGGKFEQSPMSEYLRSDVPGSMRAWARIGGANWQWKMLGTLMDSVRTGASTSNLWELFAQDKEAGDVFNSSMTSFSAAEIGPVLASYDFSSIKKLVDIAGGYGSLLAAVLKANPEMQGVLFDAPPVIEGAKTQIDAHGLSGRCELVAGDFFASVPAGDAHMMKHIIHDWDDEKSLTILKCCHAALPVGGKLLVIESVIVPDNAPSVGKMLDIEMLLIGGRERTEEDFRKLFAAAGFELTRIVPTPGPVSVVEGLKV